MSLKICKACKKEISKRAKVCPHCGNPMTMGRGKVYLICFAVVVFFLILEGGTKSYNEANHKAKMRNDSVYRAEVEKRRKAEIERKKCGKTMEAFTMAQLFINDSLKSPSTAKFAAYPYSTVKMIECGKYVVNSYVDSQNGFGATVRMKYIMDLSYDHTKDSWKMDYVITE